MRRLRHPLREAALVVLTAGVELLAIDAPAAGVPSLGGGTVPFYALAGATLAVCSLLPLRHRYPIAVFWAQWAFCLVALLVPTFIHFAATFVALYAVARRASRRTAWILLAFCAVPFGVNALSVRAYSDHAMGTAEEFWRTVGVVAALWGVVLFTTWLLGRLTYATDQRVALEQQLLAARADEALRSERLRLARELHDIVANAVSVIILTAAGNRHAAALTHERAVRALGTIESAGQQAARELDRLLGLLRGGSDGAARDTTFRQPGLDDVPGLIALARAAGVHVHVDTDGDRRSLDASAALAAYRTIQEGLTNAAKYGGRDAQVQVHLGWSASRLTVAVRSRAVGAGRSRGHVPSSGSGLAGLAERLKLLDGTLQAGAVDDGAFLVRASLPVLSAGPEAAGDGAPGDTT